jgi:Flp pilus assembly protein TadD
MQRHGELRLAEEQYLLATSLTPGNAIAWNRLGVAHALRGSMKQALAAFVRALQIVPGDVQSCHNARRAAAELGATPQELDGCRAQAG